MPQTATIQPALPKAQPQTKIVGSTGDRKQNSFSPHLDKAVSQKKQPQTNDSPAIAAKKSADVPAALNKKVKQTAELEKAPDILGAAELTGLPTSPDENDVQLALPTAVPEKAIPLADTAQLTQQIKPGEQQLRNTIIDGSEKIISPKTLSAEIDASNIEPAADNGTQTIAVKAANVLLDRLQRIIDQSDETGTVSITKVENGTPGNSINSMRNNIHGIMVPVPPENSAQLVAAKAVETSASPTVSLIVAGAEDADKVAARTSQQVTAESHDLRQQYFNPKIANAESGNARQNSQDPPPGDELQQKTLGTGPQNCPSPGLSSGPEQGNTFSQIVTTPQQPTSQMVDSPDRSVILPSGILIQEDDIIQQLSHKMQISSKNMDTRINLRLHPAELGSLKIDLTVKEGSIRANVVAQSQHTTELLEKNLAKLKTVLENQGYSVDEISITAESESVSDFDLFDRQLFSRNDYTAKSQKTGKETKAAFSLADTLFAAPAISTGVNVKI